MKGDIKQRVTINIENLVGKVEINCKSIDKEETTRIASEIAIQVVKGLETLITDVTKIEVQENHE